MGGGISFGGWGFLEKNRKMGGHPSMLPTPWETLCNVVFFWYSDLILHTQKKYTCAYKDTQLTQGVNRLTHVVCLKLLSILH